VDDEDYVRPRDRRPKKQAKPKGPAQPPKGTGPVRKPVDPATAKTGSKGTAALRARSSSKAAPRSALEPAPEPATQPPAPDASPDDA
jgi:hypothetical protein